MIMNAKLLRDAEPWRILRVDDRIRIVRMPSSFGKPGCWVHPDTRRLYRRLIARGRSVRVYQVDKDGLPWISCRFRRSDGSCEHHFLTVNDDSWEIVERRRRGSIRTRGKS